MPDTLGPFETAQEAQSHPAVRAIYEAVHESGRPAMIREGNRRLLHETLTEAGVEAGAYDYRILDWLAEYEPQMCAAVAGFIQRACEAGRRAAS